MYTIAIDDCIYTTPRASVAWYNWCMSTKRPYKRITPSVVALHQAQRIISGSGTQAVRDLEPEYINPNARAVMIQAKTSKESTVQYLDRALEQIAAVAVERVGELVNSEDERIATKNSHYAIDHIRGQSVKRSISVTQRLNIQSVLE